MNGWMDKLMNGRKDEWIDEWVEVWMRGEKMSR